MLAEIEVGPNASRRYPLWLPNIRCSVHCMIATPVCRVSVWQSSWACWRRGQVRRHRRCLACPRCSWLPQQVSQHGYLWCADEISGDLFDLLLGFGDFDEFKSLMLSYKEQFGLTGGVAPPSCAPPLCHTRLAPVRDSFPYTYTCHSESVMDFSPIITHLDVVEQAAASSEPPALAAFSGLSVSGFGVWQLFVRVVVHVSPHYCRFCL